MKSVYPKRTDSISHPLTSLFPKHSHLEVFEFLVTHRFLKYRITDLERFIKLSRPTIYEVLRDFEKMRLVDRDGKKYSYGSTRLAEQLAGSLVLIAGGLGKK